MYLIGGLYILCVPDVTIVLMFPSLFLHDIWLIYFIVLNGPMFHIVLSRLDFYNQHSGVFISYVPTVPDVTIVPYSLLASIITAHN